MVLLKKTVLKTGDYISPDGKVSVTPDRLAHWETTHNRLRKAKQVVPISWDHGQTLEQLSAMSEREYKNPAKNSAQNTIGKLVDFKVGADKQSAEMTFEITDPVAEGRATRNEVFVSPVILPEWKDGHGNKYQDCITHVDLVNHPVDHSQSQFSPAEPAAIACGLRMGLSQVYRMAIEDMKDAKDDAPETTEKSSTEGDGVLQNSSKLTDVLAALSGMKIVLSADTNEANFLDRLHSALLTAAAHQADDKQEDANEANSVQNAGDTATAAVAQQPDISTMSAQTPATPAIPAEIQAKIAWAEKAHQKSIASRLSALLATGRCSPAEHEAKKPEVQAVRLSLDANGSESVSKLEAWIESRESIPADTFWDDKSKTRMSAIGHPESVTGSLPTEQVNRVVDFAFGKGKLN